jgi:hypothetical protein
MQVHRRSRRRRGSCRGMFQLSSGDNANVPDRDQVGSASSSRNGSWAPKICSHDSPLSPNPIVTKDASYPAVPVCARHLLRNMRGPTSAQIRSPFLRPTVA